MIGRWGLYSDLVRDLKASGLRLDDAMTAARVADRAVRERRDACIRAAYRSGMTIRRIGAVWGISKSVVQHVVSGDTDATGRASDG